MIRKQKLTSNDTIAPKKTHWATGLLVSMEDPEYRVKEDDKVVVIKDKYPKAQYHYLVIPKADIPSLWHITKETEDIVFHMHSVGEDLTKEHKDSEFLIGYHAVPSMYRLHLHVISTDFNSPSLKTKYHWNSFTTPFFLPSADICYQLRDKGELKRLKSEDSAKHLNTPLRCHKCLTCIKNMPELKKHLLNHLSRQESLFDFSSIHE
ncbi:Aprataxin [Eufriesea mexicana]|nr:PREDICTED: aprataxin isoform X2 [Eufriesea mexicana]XP_017756991.1 PREDICTED: aprataxin isoform X2 [Eufriesea mexicana]XP_017756992.1 PREDICTED: aprataxin isoform X2 [Eufriesea mexicana]OAD57226.1 Aprataxin [Eufriesea mexicana]